MANGGLFWIFGIFFKPLSNEFGWSRGELSLVNTAFLMAYAPGAILWGKVADRFGPRQVLWLASLMVLAGYLGSSRIDTRTPLVLYYALMGLGTSATLSLPVATVQRWFEKKRGLMLGIVAAGTGIGALVFAPLTSRLIFSYEWRNAYIIIGIILSLWLAMGAYLMAHSPEAKGLLPYGAKESSVSPASPAPESKNEIRTRQALKTKAFWSLAALHILTFTSTLFFPTHLVPLATDRGVSAAFAAQALGLLGAMGVPGRVLMGAVADRIGWMKSIAIVNFMAASTILGLIFVEAPWMLYVFVIIFGFFNGGNMALLSGTVALFFGFVSLGELLGYTLAISVLAGSGSPLLGGLVYDMAGNYQPFLFFAMACFLTGGVYSLMLKAPKTKSSP